MTTCPGMPVRSPICEGYPPNCRRDGAGVEVIRILFEFSECTLLLLVQNRRS